MTALYKILFSWSYLQNLKTKSDTNMKQKFSIGGWSRIFTYIHWIHSTLVKLPSLRVVKSRLTKFSVHLKNKKIQTLWKFGWILRFCDKNPKCYFSSTYIHFLLQWTSNTMHVILFSVKVVSNTVHWYRTNTKFIHKIKNKKFWEIAWCFRYFNSI